jgi:chemotaxis protein histidine kinase CheA
MYQLLAGRPPFEAETYAQLVLKVGTEPPAPFHVALPPGLGDIVFRCLEKDPNQRIQNVGELARMLAPYASDPTSAQQSAERATRILTAPKGAQPGFPIAGSAGGLALTPPALTPKSWNQTGGSSLSSSAGQIATMGTKVVRGGRGLVIAGVATLCVLAGLGGFFVASSMKNDVRPAATPEAHSDEPATKREMTVAPAAAAAPDEAPLEAAKAAPTKTDPAKIDAKTDAAKADAAKADAKPDPAKLGAKTDAAKIDAKKTRTTPSDSVKSAAANPAATKSETTTSDAAKTATKSASTAHTTAHTTAQTTATNTTSAAKTSTTKTLATKASATKTSPTKASPTKASATKKPAPKQPDKHDDDLFDDRK